MSTATASAIRDRCRQLLGWIDPVSDTSVRFVDFRNEGKADFREWAEANPAAALRRFQIRNTGDDQPPEVSNTDLERRHLTLEIVISYPQTSRAGADNAMDRDDQIEEDWDAIDFNIGIASRANFGDTNDCTPLGCTKEIERGDVCDFMVITAEFEFVKVLFAGGLAGGLPAGIGGG